MIPTCSKIKYVIYPRLFYFSNISQGVPAHDTDKLALTGYYIMASTGVSDLAHQMKENLKTELIE